MFVLLDRDGVINEDRARSVRSAGELTMLPGAPEAIALLNARGYRVIVVTNQACVGRGELEPDALDAIHSKMNGAIERAGGRIEAVYVCPHTDDDGCKCRKPRPGLLDQAQRDFDFDPALTWSVGDAARDLHAARAAGCRPALVRTGKGARLDPTPGVPVFDNLTHFVETLLNGTELES